VDRLNNITEWTGLIWRSKPAVKIRIDCKLRPNRYRQQNRYHRTDNLSHVTINNPVRILFPRNIDVFPATPASVKLLLTSLLGRIAAAASDTDYSYKFLLRWSVCRSSVCLPRLCTLLKPFDGFRCHLASTLVGSNDKLC